MNAFQAVLPFQPNKSQRRKPSNLDLIGRVYLDDYVTVTVVGVCADDNRRVLVRRQPGRTSPMLAWLVRSIFDEEDRKMKRAA